MKRVPAETGSQSLRIVVFAYIFPPDAGSGTYRTLYFANRWAAWGDRVVVITAKEECFSRTATIDRQLVATVHPAVAVVRARVLRPFDALHAVRSLVRGPVLAPRGDRAGAASGSRRRSRRGLPWLRQCAAELTALPDDHVGWIPDAVRRGRRMIEADGADCIYATGGPWSGLIAAARLHRRTGIPLVLDFRDPWASNPNLAGALPLTRSLQSRLERRCIRAASAVVANTEELRRDFLSRYPALDPDRFVTVPNGFEAAAAAPPPPERSACFTLVHAGAFYGGRSPATLLRAVRALVGAGAIGAEKIRLQLIGGVPPDDWDAQEQIRSRELRELVQIVPRVGHEEALAFQRHADVLLLVQTGFPLQVPRKLYEYLAFERPVLTIAESDSATARTARELGLGPAVPNDAGAIGGAILDLYRQWEAGNRPAVDLRRLARYDNDHLAGQLRDVLARCAFERTPAGLLPRCREACR